MPYNSVFIRKKPNDLDRIIMWYEKHCPERTVHINVGIEQLENFNTRGALQPIKSDIEYACQSQIRCSVYACKTTGPNQGPRYDWACDYIDAWANSAVYNPDLVNEQGKAKNTLDVAEMIQKIKWAREDVLDERAWKE